MQPKNLYSLLFLFNDERMTTPPLTSYYSQLCRKHVKEAITLLAGRATAWEERQSKVVEADQ